MHDFIGADYFGEWRGTSTPFLKWIPSTNANISSCYRTHFGKALNTSTASVSIFTFSNYASVNQIIQPIYFALT